MRLGDVEELSSDPPVRIHFRIDLWSRDADALVELGISDEEVNAAVGSATRHARGGVGLPLEGSNNTADVAERFGHLMHLHVPIATAQNRDCGQYGHLGRLLNDRPITSGHGLAVMQVGSPDEQVSAIWKADECECKAAGYTFGCDIAWWLGDSELDTR